MSILPCWRLLLAVALTAQASAQSNDLTIRGVVRDPQGDVIPRARVDVRCGVERRHVTASATGEFAEHELPATRCRVTASSDSFEPTTVLIDAGSNVPATLVLQIRRLTHEVVVTPTRGIEEFAFSLPEAMSITSRRDIETRPYTLFPQVLREEPGILLQQTTSAHVSPIIRGQTGQGVVYLLDGVRLNTGAWRPGPSQYLAWVNGGPVDGIEIVRGGGSVQYGSDALGGTVQLLTEPALFGARTPPVGGRAEVSGATADESLSGQGDLSFRAQSATVRFGGSRRSVGDLRAGQGIDSHAAVTRFLGLPSTVLGSRQRDTSFEQVGGYGVADLNVGGGLVHALYMHETQRGVSRYDRVLGGAGLFKSGYDPEALDFGLVRYARPQVAGLGGLSATVSLNRQAEGRFEQARPSSRLDQQRMTTTAFGYQVQVHRDLGTRHLLVVGGERYDESIEASRQLVEPSGSTQTARPDIPDATSYASYGAFAQHTSDLILNRLNVRGGLRYSGYSFATRADPVLGVMTEDVSTRSLTFQAAAVITLTDALHATASVGRGFRAPNAGDLGGIGLTGGGGFEITPSRAASMGALIGSTAGSNAASTGIPVPDGLRPEVALQYEVGLKARAGRFSGTANVFDMELSDFILRRALIFDRSVVGMMIAGFEIVRQEGSGVAYVAQDDRPIVTRVNVERARVLGFDTEGEVRLNTSWAANAYFSMGNGRALPGGEYLRRMPPPMGGARLRWNGERMWVEGVASFAAEQTRLSRADLDDARSGAVRSRSSIAGFFNGTATDLGLVVNGILRDTGETLADVQHRVLGEAGAAPLFTTQPGFVVLGLRGGIRVTSRLDVTVFGENLADVNYRLYGAGLDSPGRHLQVRTRYRF